MVKSNLSPFHKRQIFLVLGSSYERHGLMRLVPRIGFMDIFMLFWAILPFFALSFLSKPIIVNLLDPTLVGILSIFLAASCLGFPMASILYFYWRGKSTSHKDDIR